MDKPYYDRYINIKKDFVLLLNLTNSTPSYINYILEHANPISRDSANIALLGGGAVKKWSTLTHNGVIFYPEYVPHGIPLKYGPDKRPYILNKEAEEFITYYVQSRFDKYRNDKFNKNFFNDWKKLLSTDLRTKITNFAECDMSDIKAYIEQKAEEKRNSRKDMDKDTKDAMKKKNDEEKEKYKNATVDDTTQVIDNFLVEPPTIFVGRGDHPLSGKIKSRIYPADITLNISKDMPIPIPKIMTSSDIDDDDTDIDTNTNTDTNTDNTIDMTSPKMRWGAIISDNTLEWIASWQNNVTGKYNYARFGRKSDFKMKSDENKYDKARMLKKKINKIREKNEANMESDNTEVRQLATALYLIDRLALRIGNEKREDEADTVGVTTLKIKNVTLMDSNVIKLDFLGKDSVRYVNKFNVPPLVYTNIKDFHDDNKKNNNDQLFDLINADSLNKYIKMFMKKLTSKVFRTYNASYLMQLELRKITNKYKDYDKPDKLTKIQHEYDLANLKVAKLCNHQKLATKSSGQQLQKTQEKLKEHKSKLNKLKREKKKKIENGLKTTAINKRIQIIQDKIKLVKSKKMIQTEAKTLSAGTSKTNYIDPRITVAFLKSNNIFDGIDKFFSKTHQSQFEWAMSVSADFKF